MNQLEREREAEKGGGDFETGVRARRLHRGNGSGRVNWCHQPGVKHISGVDTRKYPGNFFKSTREREEALVECRQRDLEDRYQDLILVVVCYTAQDGKYP